MDGDEGRLDGNAMGGILGEIFPFEMTVATTLCDNCGATEPVGKQPVYADAPGMIMRCVHCDNVLIRIAHGGRRYWLDMRGVVCLQLEEPGSDRRSAG
jgi:hypothetical protein